SSDAVGQNGDRLGVGFVDQVCHFRSPARQILNRTTATGREEIVRTRPVVRDVVAICGDLRLHEEVGCEERRGDAGNGEDVVLVDKGGNELVELARVAAVIERVLVIDFATIDAPLGIYIGEIGFFPVDERAEVSGKLAGLGGDGTYGYGIFGHTRCGADRGASRGRWG